MVARLYLCVLVFLIVWREGDRGHERGVRGRNCAVVGIKWDRRRTGSCFRGMGSVGSAGVQVRVITTCGLGTRPHSHILYI